MANIEQEERGAPGKFLDRLREALRRFIEIDPKSEEGTVILKDRFLTQSTPDTRCKLLKQAYGPKQSSNNLLQLAQTAYYSREYEGKKERQRKTKEQVEAIVVAVRTIRKQPEKNAQRDPGAKGWACYYCGKEGTSRGIALRDLSRPRLHVQSARDHTRGETAPRGIGFRGWTLKTIRTAGAQGSPHKLPS